uniref:Uncharacterized protein n=1 Tax=Panagrolaimus superbus TaxID=310955 RepID=A0A914Y580_9BILA
MSDDELFLPEETTPSNARNDFGSLFGSEKTIAKREKKSVEDLFGASTTALNASTRPNTAQTISSKKRPTVTFQDPPVTVSRNTIPTETKPETTKPPSTDLLDSLFTSSLTGGRRRQPETNATQKSAATGSGSGRRATDFLDENHSQRVESVPPNRQNDAEIENMRREISTLKYEKSEDQETIQKLQANISKLKDKHSREIEQINRRHRDEIETLNKKHEVEKSQVEKTERAQEDILTSINEYQNILKDVIDRIETIQSSTSTIQEQVGLIKDKNEESEHVIEFANNQVEEAQKRLYKELEEWEERKRQNSSAIESEFDTLAKTYKEEIIEGREWIQKERDKLYAEKRAFQEEQTNIILTFENRKEELDDLKSEFLKKEHDLLVRVVNERSTLQQQQREFELQRNADIIRLRKEAEELEVCFAQVQNALAAIESIRKDYELKNRHLQINVDMLTEHLPLHLQSQIKL